MTTRKHILGAVLGQMVGDAAGAPLEFFKGAITHSIAANAMTMCGGGLLRVGQGQITDDGELGLAAMTAAIRSDLALDVDAASTDSRLDAVAAAYRRWLRSGPFDCGNTCRIAFSPESRASMEVVALELSSYSEANGALMRAAPLAALLAVHPTILTTQMDDAQISGNPFGQELNQNQLHITQSAKADAILSHPSPVCQDCNSAYYIAIAHLINNHGDSEGAIRAAKAVVQNKTVSEWLEEATRNETLLQNMEAVAGLTMGHVKHGFLLAFHFLHFKVPFQDAIQQTLMLRGDTDTNAAIVGGLLGACYGLDGIPTFMVEPVMAFDCTNVLERNIPGHQRPEEPTRPFALAFFERMILKAGATMEMKPPLLLKMLLSLVLTVATFVAAAPTGETLPHSVSWHLKDGIKKHEALNLAAASAHLTYYGGPVIPNVEVHPIFYGNANYQSQTNAFYAGVVQSSWYDVLAQYNVYRGSAVPGFSVSATKTALDDVNDIHPFLTNLISTGQIKPTANTYYPIHFAPGISITQVEVLLAPSSYLYYGVIPDQGGSCAGGCGSNPSTVNNMFSVASHELAEAATDAAVGVATVIGSPLAWYDQTNGENGDICNAQQGTTVGGDGVTYVVQKTWSNSDNACVASGTKPVTTTAGVKTTTTAAVKTTTAAVKTTTAATTCAHSKCVTGVALRSACDTCVAKLLLLTATVDHFVGQCVLARSSPSVESLAKCDKFVQYQIFKYVW
ncbi:ADP-ribosylglycohydrolase [Rhizoclosmatium globosum]|uniref:ADP-ribosylglycohydrolase n=1 Tax=Rhizoclosmatium globosum TaxID=329046 RepID=A0A1Y2CE04_9FUNG|nr:ADP-ribosylglycohydrolase [Rhizoclosmatium globosum]|eukprot:ORY44535.1 ADP-ribosylglycohydrolase [Rhizoclosmatium globosum]